MSFTTEVKEELSRVAPGCSHCENATLAALIRIEGTLLMKGQGRYALEIATDSPVVARFIIKALHENYHLTTDLTMRRSVLHKTPNWLIEVPMQPGLNETLKELGILGEDGLERGIDPALIAKQCCAGRTCAASSWVVGSSLIRAEISISNSRSRPKRPRTLSSNCSRSAASRRVPSSDATAT